MNKKTNEASKIETAHRRIISQIPHPDSIAILQELEQNEPRSMAGFLPVVWDRAKGFEVMDPYGNKWIDFSSAVVLTNAGHSNNIIGELIKKQINSNLWFNYCNPSKIRLELIKKLREIIPPYLNKIFLLTTGSEAVEGAIKLTRMNGLKISKSKYIILSYFNSFHGRTMGAQIAGGFMDQQDWMGIKPEGFLHIPFPECFRCPWGKEKYKNCGKECFRKTLEYIMEKNICEKDIAGVITETFQGPTVAYMPMDYIQELYKWSRKNNILIVFDEMQAGFGRTGKWFGFEHYGIEADLITMGKGMTSCLPMSGIAGRSEIMDLPVHGEMSSTHTGNTLCCAATIGNIKAISEGKLVENAEKLGETANKALKNLQKKYPDYVGGVNGIGLVQAIYITNGNTNRMNAELAEKVIERCMELGLLLLPTWPRGTIKIAPPLCITEDALLEGLNVIEQALSECVDEIK